MKLSTRILTPALLFASLTLGACYAPEDEGVGPEEGQIDDAPLEEAQVDQERALDDDLVASFALEGGSTIRFFAHEDGGASIEEEGDAYHAGVLSRPELADATIFDVFFALAGPDDEAPEALVAHHEAMLAEEGTSYDREGRAKGWLRVELESDTRIPIAGNPCPGLVQNFVCGGAGSSYPGGPGCYASVGGTATWNHGTARRRYRTGFCSTGTVKAQITGSYSGPGNCIVFRPLFIYRNGFYTNHNYAYWWSGPSGATPREYDNRVEHISGPGFSWGVRDKQHTSSSCTI